jgi:hypothetical protein
VLFYFPIVLFSSKNIVIRKLQHKLKVNKIAIYKTLGKFIKSSKELTIDTSSLVKEIYFIQDSMNSESQLDSEEGLIIEVDINGMEGIIILKDESNIINWHNNNQNFYIQGNVEKSMLLKIAESILKK